MRTLALFRHGREEMSSSQLRLWEQFSIYDYRAYKCNLQPLPDRIIYQYTLLVEDNLGNMSM